METTKQITSLEDTYHLSPVLACQLALRKTVNIPAKERLEAINKLLKGYGTEAIRGDWENGYWCDIVAAYVNMGDTYATTVIHVRTGKFIITTFGDWVEKNSKKYGII